MPIIRTDITSATGTTSATVPTHAVGDLIVAFAFRDGSATAPSLPGSQNWSSPPKATRAGTSCSHRTALKIATSTSETTGTFTNATSFIVLVIPKAHLTSPIGLDAVNSGVSTSVNFPAVTPGVRDGSSFVLGLCGHRSADVSITTAPSGMTNITSVSDATDECAAHITTNGVTSWSSTNAAVGGTSSGWTSHTLVINSAQNMEAGPGLQDLSNAITQIEAGLQSLKRGYAAVIGGGGGGGGYWDPAATGSNLALSNGDRNVSYVGPGDTGFARSVTSHASGKCYFEAIYPLTDSIGVVNATADYENDYPGDANSLYYWGGDGSIYENGGSTGYGAATSPGDVIGIAVDLDSDRIYFAINNTWQNSANPVAGTGGYSYAVSGALYAMGVPNSNDLELRTADGDFSYTPPTGFTAWG